MATDDENINGGDNNYFFTFYLALDSMKKNGVLENDPDIDKAFENSLKKYMNTKKQMETFQAITAKNNQSSGSCMETIQTFCVENSQSNLDGEIATLTRNISDFTDSSIPAITPESFIAMIGGRKKLEWIAQ